MFSDSKTASLRGLAHIDPGPPGEDFGAIDIVRSGEPGMAPRDTWITEAVQETLTRNRAGVGLAEGRSFNA